MIHIAVVDDNALSLEMTSAMIKNYINENNAADITYTTFQSPLELMACVEEGADFNVFLLDIVMPGMDGISVAKELRALGIGFPIIFLTAKTQYALDAFRVGAAQYLIKGFSYRELADALDKALQIIGKERRRYIILSTRSGYRHIFCRNIMYCVSNKNYQDIVLDSNETLDVRMSHKALTGALTQSINFIEVGSSYIVNMFYIAELNSSEMTMADSFTIQIPQRQSWKVKDAYKSFFRHLASTRPSFQIL